MPREPPGAGGAGAARWRGGGGAVLGRLRCCRRRSPIFRTSKQMANLDEDPNLVLKKSIKEVFQVIVPQYLIAICLYSSIERLQVFDREKKGVCDMREEDGPFLISCKGV